MFNRYWRSYPPFLQGFLFIMMVFTLFFFSIMVANALVPWLTGVSLTQAVDISPKSSPGRIRAARIFQLINSICTFALPSLLFAYLTHPRPAAYLGLRRPTDQRLILPAVLLTIAAIPLIGQLGTWMRQIDFGEAARRAQDQADGLYQAFLQMHGPGDLILSLFLFAAIPAIGEELMFRGIVMRFAYRRTGNVFASAFISAILFAIVHAQLQMMLPLLLGGLMLGYIYYLSGSLWVSILAHFIFNGIQIVIAYMTKGLNMENPDASVPVPLVLGGLALAGLAGWWLYQKAQPRPDWASDFDPEELKQDPAEDH